MEKKKATISFIFEEGEDGTISTRHKIEGERTFKYYEIIGLMEMAKVQWVQWSHENAQKLKKEFAEKQTPPTE